MDSIILGGGCFWGLEHLLGKHKGVVSTSVGYAGGNLSNPDYNAVKTGETGHVESVKVSFNSSEVSLTELLEFFFKIHDPTTENQQGNDVGTQYRSVIFYNSEGQKSTALQVIKATDQSGRFKDKVVTSVEALSEYYLAEDYHQKYLDKNPSGYTCHFIRD